MIFPFDSLSLAQREAGLVVAVLLGFAFGFVLERAGFGRAPKLAAQFYLHDMTVFKVMFGAIVTAMLGMVLFSRLGWVDLRAVADAATSSTFLWPMVLGGFVLGLGFIIAGYCPGTSIVSAASGNLDGAMAFAGVIAGTFAYSELLPLLGKFPESSDLGHFYLDQLLRLPAPVVALLVAGMAIGCFWGAEKVEKIFTEKLRGAPVDDEARSPARPRRQAFATFAAGALLGVATLALPSPRAGAQGAPPLIAQGDFARRLLDTPWKLRIIDLRPRGECEARRIPGSECVPAEDLAKLGLADEPPARQLILVGASELDPLPSAALAYRGPIARLAQGFAGWQFFALTPPLPGSDDYGLRLALHGAMTGIKQPPPPPPVPAGGAAPRKRGGSGGCSG